MLLGKQQRCRDEENTHLPPVQFSANRCSGKGSWARGWIWAGLSEKRTKEEYLTTTVVLAADTLKKKKGILYICVIKNIFLHEILKLFTDMILQEGNLAISSREANF